MDKIGCFKSIDAIYNTYNRLCKHVRFPQSPKSGNNKRFRTKAPPGLQASMAQAAVAGVLRPTGEQHAATAPLQLVKRAFIVCVAPWYFPAMFVARQAKLLCGPTIRQPIVFYPSHFTSLPNMLQIDILKALPLVDRLRTETPSVWCTHMFWASIYCLVGCKFARCPKT